MAADVAILAIIVPVVIVCSSAFVSVLVWTQARRKEREALYRSEALKKVSETSGPGAETALEMMREHLRADRRRRREIRNLAGVLSAAAGLGLMIFLRANEPGTPTYLSGMIPLIMGVALLAFGRLTNEKD